MIRRYSFVPVTSSFSFMIWLLSENIFPVADRHETVVNKPVKSERVLKRGEQAYHMDLLFCGQFHAGDHSNP